MEGFSVYLILYLCFSSRARLTAFALSLPFASTMLPRVAQRVWRAAILVLADHCDEIDMLPNVSPCKPDGQKAALFLRLFGRAAATPAVAWATVTSRVASPRAVPPLAKLPGGSPTVLCGLLRRTRNDGKACFFGCRGLRSAPVACPQPGAIFVDTSRRPATCQVASGKPFLLRAVAEASRVTRFRGHAGHTRRRQVRAGHRERCGGQPSCGRRQWGRR